MPPNVEEFSLKDGVIEGVCTHPELVKYEWLTDSYDFYWDEKVIPEGFFASAIECTMHADRLVVAWKLQGRAFHFRQRYMLVCANIGESIESTNDFFEDYVEAWEKEGND